MGIYKINMGPFFDEKMESYDRQNIVEKYE